MASAAEYSLAATDATGLVEDPAQLKRFVKRKQEKDLLVALMAQRGRITHNWVADFRFLLRNRHPLVAPFLAHPHHPYSRAERAVSLLCTTTISMFFCNNADFWPGKKQDMGSNIALITCLRFCLDLLCVLGKMPSSSKSYTVTLLHDEFGEYAVEQKTRLMLVSEFLSRSLLMLVAVFAVLLMFLSLFLANAENHFTNAMLQRYCLALVACWLGVDVLLYCAWFAVVRGLDLCLKREPVLTISSSEEILSPRSASAQNGKSLGDKMAQQKGAHKALVQLSQPVKERRGSQVRRGSIRRQASLQKLIDENNAGRRASIGAGSSRGAVSRSTASAATEIGKQQDVTLPPILARSANASPELALPPIKNSDAQVQVLNPSRAATTPSNTLMSPLSLPGGTVQFVEIEAEAEDEEVMVRGGAYAVPFAELERRAAAWADSKGFVDLPIPVVRISQEELSRWDFDVLDYDPAVLGWAVKDILLRIGGSVDMPKCQLHSFIRVVEECYCPDNAYHNYYHGVFVLQSCFSMLVNMDVGAHLTDFHKLSLLVAAVCHDIGHPGVNNAHLVATKSKLAAHFEDKSVLENFHVARTLRILRSPTFDICANMGDHDVRRFRQLLSRCILATDMAKHFDLLKAFKEKVEAKLVEPEDVMEMTLKCADIGNAAKAWKIAGKWNARISEEFYLQGDTEKQMGLPVMEMMDRELSLPAKNSIGFISFLAEPLFKPYATFFPKAGVCLDLIQINKAELEKLLPAQASSRASTTAASLKSPAQTARSSIKQEEGGEEEKEVQPKKPTSLPDLPPVPVAGSLK